MKKLPVPERSKTMLSYFVLAVGILCAAKIIWEYQRVMGVLQYGLSLITPFLCGFALAYILNLPCGWLQGRLGRSKSKFVQKRKRMLSILATYGILLLLIALVVRLIVPGISASIEAFRKNFSLHYGNAQALFAVINSWQLLPTELSVDLVLGWIKDYSLENISHNIAVSWGALSSVFSAVFTFFLALVSSIYILVEKDSFKGFACRFLRVFLRPRAAELTLKYAGNLNRSFRQYIYCQTIDGCILGTLATIELFLIGSPYFLLLGVMLGIVNYIPYFGAIIGSLAAIAIVGFTQGLQTAVIAAAVLLVTQQIDGNLIQPRLMGGSFSISPLLIIISTTIGGTLAGPLGMIAAIPIVAVLKGMVDDLMAYMERRKQGPAEEEAEEGPPQAT